LNSGGKKTKLLDKVFLSVYTIKAENRTPGNRGPRRFPGGGENMTDNILVIHPRDNVAVALRSLGPGEEAKGQGLEGFDVLEPVPPSHKIAIRDLAPGEEIVKYGEVVAVTSRGIKKGEWVHTHNLESQRWRK
jgi:altronate dehydratase